MLWVSTFYILHCQDWDKHRTKYVAPEKTVNLFFNLESGGDISRIQNAVTFEENNNNEVPDGRVRPLLSCLLRRVVLCSFRSRDRRFGGFCGAVDVRARFRGNVVSALGEEITRQFDFGIFAGLPRFEWNWIHDSRSGKAARPREPVSLSPLGFLKDYRLRRGRNTFPRIWGFFLSLNSAAAVVKSRNTAWSSCAPQNRAARVQSRL